MAYSGFGRRVAADAAANAGGGTDHGTAGPDDGDLHHTTDFRRFRRIAPTRR